MLSVSGHGNFKAFHFLYFDLTSSSFLNTLNSEFGDYVPSSSNKLLHLTEATPDDHGPLVYALPLYFAPISHLLHTAA